MTPTDHPSEVDKARQAVSGPVFNSLLKVWVGEGKLDYERYLRTGELLRLQLPREELAVPEELMFQVVHQAQEIWLKLLAHELADLVGDLDAGALWEGAARLDRAVRITRCLAGELHVLETLTPDTYQVIRRHLGSGSGQESPGYNAVRLAAGYLAGALDRLLVRHDTTLPVVYGGAGRAHPRLSRICELLVDLDEGFQTWLFTHFMLVRRTIGVGRRVTALDGMPSQVLVGRMTQPLFGSLWKVREQMTAGWRREGGSAPGTDRS
jgi:tryptophan 2,3-dioxygenase